MSTSGKLLGSIIATIISIQPPTNARARSVPPPTAAAASWLSKREYGELPQAYSASQASPTSASIAAVKARRPSTTGRMSGLGLKGETTLDRVVVLEVDLKAVLLGVDPIVRRLTGIGG